MKPGHTFPSTLDTTYICSKYKYVIKTKCLTNHFYCLGFSVNSYHKVCSPDLSRLQLNLIESNWIQLIPIDSKWIKLNHIELNWIKSNWIQFLILVSWFWTEILFLVLYCLEFSVNSYHKVCSSRRENWILLIPTPF